MVGKFLALDKLHVNALLLNRPRTLIILWFLPPQGIGLGVVFWIGLWGWLGGKFLILVEA